jgi:hypothetical protein
VVPIVGEDATVRHFGYLSAAEQAALFESPPEPFTRDSGHERLSVALGATLYMPADRPSLVADVVKQAAAGVTSVVVCLEDAIPDEHVPGAEDNLVRALTELDADPAAELPLLFVRVREPRRCRRWWRARGAPSGRSTGSCCPSSPRPGGTEYLHALDDADRRAAPHRPGQGLLAMPVIESGAVLYAETRVDELTRLRALLHRDRARILAVRLGATDLCALYGLRRSPELSIYDVKVGQLADRRRRQRAGPRRRQPASPSPARSGSTTPPAERLFKPQLRRSPFDEHDETDLRGRLVSRAIDGLIREVQLGPGQRAAGQDRDPPEPRRRRQRAVGGVVGGVPRRPRVLDAGRGSGRARPAATR